MCLFLASDKSSYITVQTINVNGGLFLGQTLKTILFISAGIESIPGIKLANKMGYYTAGVR